MDNEKDKQLIADYLDGNELALKELINQYLKPIYNFIYHFIGGRPEAEDITQEVFVKMWRNLKKPALSHSALSSWPKCLSKGFNPKKGSFKTWLYVIARNTAIDFLKKKKHLNFSDLNTREENANIENILVDPEPLPSELFDQKDLSEKLLSVMQKLSPHYRAIIFLHYHNELTFQEIAEIFNQPLNTVKSQHLRALIKLRELIK